MMDISERELIQILADAAHRGLDSDKLTVLSSRLRNGDGGELSPETAEAISQIILGVYRPAPEDDVPEKFLMTGSDLQLLDLHVEWALEDLIPEKAITTVTGPAGSGKSFLLLNVANAIDRGEAYLGLSTKRLPSYILDYENPLPVDVERVRLLGVTTVRFWHSSFELPPPRIDSQDYELIKRLRPGLLIVDGLRASQQGDENSSKDMGLVMAHWKEIRDLGFTVVIIHHTTKANEQISRGSQALIDQADHVVYFYPVRKPGSDDPADVEDPDSMTYFLGSRDKTRFKLAKLYVKRMGQGRFVVAGDPKDEKIAAMAELLGGHDRLTQKEFLKLVRDELSFGKPTILQLMKQGTERGIWTVNKGDKNASLFQLSSYSPLYRGVKTGKQKSGSFQGELAVAQEENAKTVAPQELSSFPDSQKKTGKRAGVDIEADPRFLDSVLMREKQGSTHEEAVKKTTEFFKEAGWI